MKKRIYGKCVECGRRTTGRCYTCGCPLHLLECGNGKIGMECSECVKRRVEAEDREEAEIVCGKSCRAEKLEDLINRTE